MTAIGKDAGERLNEFDKTEWRDVVRKLKPDIADEQFERSWAEFQAEKSRRHAQ